MNAILALLLLLISPSPPPLPRAVFVGDSVTSAEDSYAVIASERYGWEMTRFFYPHFGDALALWNNIEAERPDIIVIEMGVHAIVGCDHLAGHDSELFRYYVGQVLDNALWTADTVIVVNIPWMNWGTILFKAPVSYNAIIADEAAARGVPVVDAWTAMLVCGQTCIGDDGFHPNTRGQVAIADALPDVTLVRYQLFLPDMRWTE